MDRQEDMPTESVKKKIANDECGEESSTSSNEMLIDDEEDEDILDEVSDESHTSEIEALQNEMDMPLEDLLRLYSCENNGQPSSSGDFTKESFDLVTEKAKQNEDDSHSGSLEGLSVENDDSHLKLLYEEGEDQSLKQNENYNSVDQTNDHNQETRPNELEEDVDDPDYKPYTLRTKAQKINVGENYQSDIPELTVYGDDKPYENEDRLLWTPQELQDEKITEYLKLSRQFKVNDIQARINLGDNLKESDAKQNPVVATKQATSDLSFNTCEDYKKFLTDPNRVADDEEALYLLMQCSYDVDEAMRRRRLSLTVPTNLSLWSDIECERFEEGIIEHGKDFALIQKKVKTRSVDELINFYYVWKKTDRYDVILNRIKANNDMLDIQTRKTN